MKKLQGQVHPGNEKEPRRFDALAAPRQEERGIPLPFSHGNASVGQKEPPAGLRPAEFENGPTHTYEHGTDPSGYFARVAITLVGAPDDDGRRARLVRDMLWGRLSPDRGDTGPAARVPDPKPPPVLEAPDQDQFAA